MYIEIIKALLKVQISSDSRENQRGPKENQKGSPNGSKEPPLTKGTAGDLCSLPSRLVFSCGGSIWR